jgi:mono/diheme cytochrome c family protein
MRPRRLGEVPMRPVLKAFALLVAIVVAIAAVGLWYLLNSGVSAKEQPGRIEEFAARRVRNMAIANRARSLTNPVVSSGEVIAEGRAHFADHCAVCHANDGSGDTPMGRGMWPKAPDLRLAATQDLSDGELFWIIENGIRFTGMPAWGTGTKDGEEASWHLVLFIRRLPRITAPELEEMESLNPKAPAEIRQQMEEEKFLNGGGDTPISTPATPHKHPGGRDE